MLTMPRSEDPNPNFPAYVVKAIVPGMGPEDLEDLVADPLEGAIGKLSDIDEEWPNDTFFTQVGMHKLKGSFSVSLIYSGMADSVCHCEYREYSDSLIRPAFTQQIVYDLAESNKIAFRGIEMEILEANNRFIAYRVLSDEHIDWMP
jgi:hypothetical protein